MLILAIKANFVAFLNCTFIGFQTNNDMPKVPIKKKISLLKHFHEKKNNVHNDFGEKKASEGPLGV